IRPGFIFDFVNLSVAIMGPAFLVTWLAGMFWRRATKEAAILSLVVGVVISVYWFYNPIVLFGRPWLNGPVVSFVVVAAIMVVLSFVTKPTAASLELYDRLKRTRGGVNQLSPAAK